MVRTEPVATLPRSGPIPSLDGIRALAVLLVFLAHSGLERVVPGGLGVTIFFVLSGFLITTLLRIERAGRARIDMRGFYLRRLVRLMPPLVLVVASAGLLSMAGLVDGAFSRGGLAAALLYLGNYHVIWNDFRGMPAGMGLVWSLAIEEHFYLVYPPLAALLLGLRRPGHAALAMAALCALVLAWRGVLVAQGAPAAYIGMATDTRIDAIGIGCLMALWRNPWLDRRPAAPTGRDAVFAAACVLLLLASLAWRDETFRLTLRYTVQALAIAGLIHQAVAFSHHRPYRWLQARPLVYLGTVSYTVYLSHQVILLGIARQWPAWGWGATTLLAVVLTWAVAEPMRRWVEAPCAAWRRRLHRPALPARPAAAILPVVAP